MAGHSDQRNGPVRFKTQDIGHIFDEPCFSRSGGAFEDHRKLADLLGIEDTYRVASSYLQARLLPWISFHRDDKAMGDESRKKLDVLEEWASHNTLNAFSESGGLRQSLYSLLERCSTSLVVKYLE